MVHPSKMLPFKFYDLFLQSSSCNPSLIQKIFFELKQLSQGRIEKDHLSKNVLKIGSDKMINFSNESFKIPTIYDLLFIIAIYSLKNVNKHSSEMKISTKQSLYNKHSFSQFGAYFVCRPKIMTYCQVFQKIIFGTRPSKKKIKSVKRGEILNHFLEDSGLNRV